MFYAVVVTEVYKRYCGQGNILFILNNEHVNSESKSSKK